MAPALFLLLQCTSCVYGRMFYFNTPSLAAPTYFDGRPVHASATPLLFERAAREASFPMRASRNATYPTFDSLLYANKTRAFLVLHHDAIVYERYFGRVTAETRLPAFSMSKTFAAALVGCAVDDGLLASPDERLVDVVPDLAPRRGYANITLEHLLRMTSGIDFTEDSTAGAVLYYTTDLTSQSHQYRVTRPPGTHYQYGSVNIQLLWEALHNRLRGETVAGYFERRFWSPIGAEHDAAWDLDSKSNGVEKLFAGLSATARDYARLGVLFQHRGKMGENAVLPASWVVASLANDPIAGVVETSDGDVRRGRYQWFWTLDERAYFSKGYNGQYVYVDEVRDVVIVRFGEGYGDVDWTSLFSRIAASL